MATKRTSSSTPLDISAVTRLSKKKEVTIVLDTAGTSEEAKMGVPYSYSSKTKILRIAVDHLSAAERKIVLGVVRAIFNNDELIWKQSKEEVLNSYKEYYSQKPDNYILQFFEPILTRDDFTALKMSLYLRSEQDKKQNISVYKTNIRDRFGERGANIANLCTAGYFETEFMPLFNVVPREAFNEYYEIAVGKKARALFVHSGTDISKSFNEMLEKALRYHMEDFRIHGIGTRNVEAIKEFCANKEVKTDDKFIIQKGYEKITPPAVDYIVRLL